MLREARRSRLREDRANRGLEVLELAARPQETIGVGAFSDAPRLDVWHRLDVARSLVVGGPFNRSAKCQRTRRISVEDTGIRRFDSGAYALDGLVACGSMACPHCGVRRARSTASALGVTMARHHDASELHDTWMLTLAPPHHLDENPRETVDKLYTAKELLWRSHAWQSFAEEWGLVGRVTALDMTFGGRNGLHAHFHSALFPTLARVPNAWLAGTRASDKRVVVVDESGQAMHRPREPKRGVAPAVWQRYHVRVEVYETARRAAVDAANANMVDAVLEAGELETALRSLGKEQRERWLDHLRVRLLPAWEDACREVGFRITEHNEQAFRTHGIELSPSENAARYFVKWGLNDEVGATPQKDRSHLRLLDLVANGCDRAGDMYLQFRAATDGKAWVIGLGDARHRYEVTDEDCEKFVANWNAERLADLAAKGEPLPEKKLPLAVRLRANLFGVAIAGGWPALFAELDRLADDCHLDGEALQRGLDHYLVEKSFELAKTRGTRAPPGGYTRLTSREPTKIDGKADEDRPQ